ncbi:hypothetical protein ISN45_Aa08g012800 [Arabidopsis thaliana x Arabidopsis arenosa]|uniref:Uncharacterized protein n=1 Tax=Arabidopsis thaliana x Arabidopsis arenosa TaxID=1240361 RepID=A0A8T1XHN8_9BRAS|nr:hypothetical protein ISN45_Aa08g012800 [Arabidopsis thaliana x Arabidopsis arenosa]
MVFSKSLLFLLLVPLLCYYTLITKKLLPQTENPVKHTSEAEGNAYELQKQIFELRQELEMQRKRSLEVEARAEIADKKVAELSSKLENIDGKWLLSKLGLNLNKTQAYIMTLWHQDLSQTLQKKWIPSIKDAYVTLTIFLEPKVQYLTDKSIEVLHTCKQALTPHLIQAFDVSYDYLEVSRVMTIGKPHFEKVQVALEAYTENVRHGFEKLVNSTKVFWRTK